MKFLGQLLAAYRLYRDGKLNDVVAMTDTLRTTADKLNQKKNDIGVALTALEKDVGMTKARLGHIQDAVVRQSMDSDPVVFDCDSRHVSFETTYRTIAAGCSPFLVGPAGSGKSTILAQVADLMDLPFYPMSVNSLTSDYNIIGYNDANGKYVPTIFRQAYEHGGIFSFEEIDAGNPNVLTVINNAMSQDRYAFPDKIVDKHPRFILAASGNTYGTGASIQYVGRNPLDAAPLDRFVMVYTDYDTKLEDRLCANKEWLHYVHAVRHVVAALEIKLVVGTRAVLNGEKLINAGVDRAAVERMVLFKGLPISDINKIQGRVRGA